MSIQAERFQVRSKSLIIFNQYETHYNLTKAQRDQKKAILLQAKKYSGDIKKGSKKRITAAIELLVQRAREKKVYNPIIDKVHSHRLSFITLTIPDLCIDMTPSESYERLLKPWLRKIGQKNSNFDYVWKLEYQERGNIHYHVTTNLFIPHHVIKEYWNRIIENAGLMDNYKLRFNSNAPNSTDIHSVYKLKDVTAYLVKYVSKEVKRSEGKEEESGLSDTTIRGKIWGCSEKIKGLKLYTDYMTYSNAERIEYLVKRGFATIIYSDHCTIVRLNGKRVSSIMTSEQIKDYKTAIYDT